MSVMRELGAYHLAVAVPVILGWTTATIKGLSIANNMSCSPDVSHNICNRHTVKEHIRVVVNPSTKSVQSKICDSYPMHRIAGGIFQLPIRLSYAA
jgi:hypothetical protein